MEAWHRNVWRPVYIRPSLQPSLPLACTKALSKTLPNIHGASHVPAPPCTSADVVDRNLVRFPRAFFFRKTIRPKFPFGAPEGSKASGVRNAKMTWKDVVDDLSMCMRWLVNMCDMCHDLSICIKWLVNMCDMTCLLRQVTCAMTHLRQVESSWDKLRHVPWHTWDTCPRLTQKMHVMHAYDALECVLSISMISLVYMISLVNMYDMTCLVNMYDMYDMWHDLYDMCHDLSRVMHACHACISFVYIKHGYHASIIWCIHIRVQGLGFRTHTLSPSCEPIMRCHGTCIHVTYTWGVHTCSIHESYMSHTWVIHMVRACAPCVYHRVYTDLFWRGGL